MLVSILVIKDSKTKRIQRQLRKHVSFKDSPTTLFYDVSDEEREFKKRKNRTKKNSIFPKINNEIQFNKFGSPETDPRKIIQNRQKQGTLHLPASPTTYNNQIIYLPATPPKSQTRRSFGSSDSAAVIRPTTTTQWKPSHQTYNTMPTRGGFGSSDSAAAFRPKTTTSPVWYHQPGAFATSNPTSQQQQRRQSTGGFSNSFSATSNIPKVLNTYARVPQQQQQSYQNRLWQNYSNGYSSNMFQNGLRVPRFIVNGVLC